MRHLSLGALALGVLATPAIAQSALPFPMDRAGLHAGTDQPVLRPRADSIRALTGLGSVVLEGLALPTGRTVDLSLRRVPVEGLGIRFHVDGLPAPDLLADLDLSVWRGTVVGDPRSEVLLSFSRAGSRGWVTADGEVSHLMPQPGGGGDWREGYSVLVTTRTLTQLGMDLGFDCGAEALPSYAPEGDAMPWSDVAPTPSPQAGSSVLYECKVAIETDYQLNELFGGDLQAETAYVTTLIAAGSDRYVEQFDTVLTYPYVQFYTTPADPWSSQDGGGNSIDVLDEFVAEWGGSALPGDADLGHFLSGASLGGGVAYLSVLCDTSHDFSFGVSGNVDGLTPFPVQQGPTNWDFVVFTHELGHNFSSPHTHDYCPPIDECAPAGFWGQCQDEEDCISDGTLMGYCHLCPGGLSNVTTLFHPDVVAHVEAHVSSCLPEAAGISAVAPPQIVAPDVPATLTAQVLGTPTASVDLNYRFDEADPFSVVAMTSQGGGVYSAELPAPSCTDDPEFFFSTVEAALGAISTDAFAPEVGVQQVQFADDFQTDMGWTVGAFDDDATTGVWERVDPNGTAAQPSEGVSDGSGALCYVTGQGPPGGGLGDNDVDGGKTTLFSPVIDLAGGDATVSYYRWFSNDTGSAPNEDVFVVEITNDGSSWANVETVGPTGAGTGGGWVYHEFDVSDFVAPTSDVQVRFVASDEGSGSLVEAGVDSFEVFRLSCDVCQPDLGFGGPGSLELSLCGPPLETGNVATLELTGAPPSSAALIVFSSTSNPLSIEGGTLVPNPVEGFATAVTGGSGGFALPVPGGAATTLYVQTIVLDGGSSTFLFSNAIEAEFL